MYSARLCDQRKVFRTRLQFVCRCPLVAIILGLGAGQALAQCTEQQKLTASDAAPGDFFGFSVSVSGGTAVVGAWEDDCAAGTSRRGSAYVFRFNGSSWVEEQKLTASDAAAWDRFGNSVSVSGDTAVVGALWDDCAALIECGSAYVFRFNGTSWVQEQKLTASDAEWRDWFGASVSVSGDTIVVGAILDDCEAGVNCGSAYVFRFNGTDWVEERKLTASDAWASDIFGVSVSVSGSTAVVGAFGDDCAMGGNCGSAYVYRFNGTAWVEEQKLTASDAGADDKFGVSVSVSGDTAVVGAWQNDCAAGDDCGAAYVFRFNGTGWDQEQKLTACDEDEGDRFGRSVSVSADTVVAGAHLNDCPAGDDCGSMYVFDLVQPCLGCGNCNLDSEEECDGGLGCTDCLCDSGFEPTVPSSVDCQPICGNGNLDAGELCDGMDDVACPGLCQNNCTCGPFCGDGTCDSGEECSCAVDCGLPSSSEVHGATCGDGLDNDCDGIIDSDDPDCAVSQCIERQKLTASDAAAGDDFGVSVSVSGETAVVGASSDACAAGDWCGSAYVFRFNGTSWVEEQKLTASDAANDIFGTSVSVSGETAVVGARWDDCAAGSSCGSAYVFRFNGTSWVEEQKLTASDADWGDQFGFSLSVTGDIAVVGATGDECAAGVDCGAAYVFRFNGTSWVEEQKLTACDAGGVDLFGHSVSVSGDTAVVGAFRADCAAGGDCGSAYVYRFNGTIWVEEQKLTASDAAAGDRFGNSVSVSEDTAVVGAIFDDCAADAGSSCGSAYVYRFNGTSWVEEQKLTASDAAPGDRFGNSVSVSEDTVVVLGGGTAFLFRFDGTSWVAEQKLTDADNADFFGNSVSVSGDIAVVGVRHDNCAAGASCGSARVFRCLASGTCADAVAFIGPQAGTVDARQPHAMHDPSSPMGIDTILVLGTPGTEVLECWSLCESDDGGSPNSITSIDNHGDGTYTLHLDRPITKGAATTVTATLGDGSVVSAMYTLHPGNVNDDNFVTGLDLLLLLDVLNGEASAPWGDYSVDIDHSGQVAAPDILRLIDLFNGAGEYDSWLGTMRPGCGVCCPAP